MVDEGDARGVAETWGGGGHARDRSSARRAPSCGGVVPRGVGAYTPAMLHAVVAVLYLACLLAVGLRKAKAVHGQEGFSLAGRSLTVPILVGTLVATWTGTGSIFGNAGEAYRVGFPSLLIPIGSIAGLLVLASLSGRVRGRERFTLQDVLEERFGAVARVLGTLTLVLAYLVIVANQLRAGEAVLAQLARAQGWTPLDPLVAKVGVALFIATYTGLAGMMSVALTDTFNGVLMIVGLVIALPIVWSVAGGVDAVMTALPSSAQQVGGHYSGLEVASMILPPFLLIIGDANLHQRFLSARSESTARSAALWFIPAVLAVETVILLVAIGTSVALPDVDPDRAVLALALTDGVLPAALGAVLLACVLAIIVSTADSYLLACSSSLVRDVYQRFARRDASERELLTTARVVVLLLTIPAILLATSGDDFFRLALFAYTIYGVGITPPLVAALFWPRATPAGAVASMVTAVAVAIAWKVGEVGPRAAELLGDAGGSVGAVVPAVVVSAVVLVGVSLVTRPRPA